MYTWHVWEGPPLHFLAGYINHFLCLPQSILLEQETHSNTWQQSVKENLKLMQLQNKLYSSPKCDQPHCDWYLSLAEAEYIRGEGSTNIALGLIWVVQEPQL